MSINISEMISKKVCYPARYNIVDWGKRQNKALSTVVIEKTKSVGVNFADAEINGTLFDMCFNVFIDFWYFTFYNR